MRACPLFYAYGDAMHGTMLYYGVMIAALWLLFRAALRLEAGRLILWGNLLSFGMSLAALRTSSLEERAWYFKPFTPLGLIALIAGAAAAVQGILLLPGRKKRSGMD